MEAGIWVHRVGEVSPRVAWAEKVPVLWIEGASCGRASRAKTVHVVMPSLVWAVFRCFVGVSGLDVDHRSRSPVFLSCSKQLRHLPKSPKASQSGLARFSAELSLGTSGLFCFSFFFLLLDAVGHNQFSKGELCSRGRNRSNLVKQPYPPKHSHKATRHWAPQ